MSKIYIDFRDGEGFRDVTKYIKDNSVNITINAGNSKFKGNQNTASFSIYMSGCCFIREVVGAITGIAITGSSQSGAEATYRWITLPKDLLIEIKDDVGTYLFKGHAPAIMSRTYTGDAEIEYLSISASDSMDLLSTHVGDVVYRNYSIYDPASPETSIIHQLAYIAGFTEADLDDSITISDTMSVFAPQNVEDDIRGLIETILFEHGWILHFTEEDKIKPVKWIHTTGELPDFLWNESNVGYPVKVKENTINTVGVSLVYYHLGRGVTTSGSYNILLYMDSGLPYDSDGSFAGYNILGVSPTKPDGYTYPPETNVIDDTTGEYQEVWQEYTTNSIKYFTNKAIMNDLDHNYKAFDSDFSDIIATDRQWIDWKADDGIVLDTDTLTFDNKRCRYVFRNPTADDSLKLYYANVYGIVDYKTAQKTIEINPEGDSDNLQSYECKYIYGADNTETTENATLLAQYLDTQVQLKEITFQFYSGDSAYKVDVGTYCTISLKDGTFSRAIIQTRQYNEYTDQYTYTLRGVI